MPPAARILDMHICPLASPNPHVGGPIITGKFNVIVGKMPQEHRRFLSSFKKGKPEWDILGIPHVETLPAVQWRLQNLAKADAKKREKLIGDLHKALGIEE